MAFDIGGLIAGIFKPAKDLVDDLHTSVEEKLEMKAKINEIAANAQGQIFDYITKMAEQQAKVISAEAMSRDTWVRRWRPILMYMIIAILGVKYLVEPLIFSWVFPAFPGIELPDRLYTLLEIGVGGYIVGRSGEKIAERWQK